MRFLWGIKDEGGPIMSERASEIAEAILIVIRRILKWLAVAVGGALGLGAVAAACTWGWSYYT